ncbi:hypothetical protein RvY_10426-2 [Ramazzottius varieornatus]|uniref:BTB domain-containing protein n=2 Tax=Ramazzottius varieornatus TaxID=947166 RepID=A0A1D1VI25_RAMVA|nr:hypothetical protein RvY_10426-2 [Ramazzottius varieornatus]
MLKNVEQQVETSWQNVVSSVTSMVGSLFQKNQFCDVIFRVGAAGQMEDIKAHRNLLASRSPVFAAMFYGPVAEQKEIIELVDCDPDIFKLILEFIYRDSSDGINQDSIIEMYRLADKYDIGPLKKLCAQKVKDCISMEKLGEFLELNDLYDDEVIDQHCSDFLACNAWKLSQKEEYFINLSLEHLTSIWQHDTNPEGANKLPETDIYNGAVMISCSLERKLPT